MKVRDSLVLDDLEPGGWYEFIRPSGHILRGKWEGFEGRLGAVHLPPGTLPLFPHGVTLMRPCSYWSECTITEMPDPDEQLHLQREYMDAQEVERLPLTRREKRVIVLAVVAAAFFWGSLILWVFGR